EVEITSIIQSHPVAVFSKTYCPYSQKAKAILNEYALRAPLYVVEVDLREDAQQVKDILGQTTGRYTFPNVFLQGNSIGGADELERLHRNGHLKDLLRKYDVL
ncbi:thioredoxin-like protein, partial [Dichotomocladium elegans]